MAIRKNIYICSSWKQRENVRKLAAELRKLGHEVYDFTDPNCRKYSEIVPPEKYPEPFDPEIHNYYDYLSAKNDLWYVVLENKRVIKSANVVILLLPCGNDAHVDWGYGAGLGKMTFIVGHPGKGERSPAHLWASFFFKDIDDLLTRGREREWI